MMGRRSYLSRQAFGSSHNENRGQMEQLMAGRRKRPALHLHQQFSPVTPPPISQPVDRDLNKERKRSVTDFLDSLFEPVLSGSTEDLTNPMSLQTKLKGRGGMPPPPPGSKRPPGAVPLLPPTPRGQQNTAGAVANMAAAFAQRQQSKRHVIRDDASSVASEPMSNFARQLAARKAALATTGDNQGTRQLSNAAGSASEFQRQLFAKKTILSQPDTHEDFPYPSHSPQTVFHSPLVNDEIMLSVPPHPSFPPPPPPEDGESPMSPPPLGDPFAPSHHVRSSEYNLANDLNAAAVSVSGIDSGLLKRVKPVRLLKMIQGPAVTYNRPSWSISVRKEVWGIVVTNTSRPWLFVSRCLLQMKGWRILWFSTSFLLRFVLVSSCYLHC